MQTEYNSLKNVIIGFDPVASTVRVFRLSGTDVSTAVVNDIIVERNLFDRGEYGEALKQALGYYVKNVADLQNAYVILPNKLVASDYISLPKLIKKKLMEALRTEIDKLYSNSVLLSVQTNEVDSGRAETDNTLFFVTLTNTLFINDISTGLARSSVQPRLFSFSAPCSLCAALDRRPDLKSKNFVFVDVRKHSTLLTVCSQGDIRAYYEFPFGTSVLRTDVLYPEAALFDNAEARQAVSAAMSKASGGKSEREDAIYVDDPALSEVEQENARIKYYTEKTPVELRRQAESEEELDVLYANFGVIEKRVDLFVSNNCGTENIPSCDLVLVNLPEEYYLLKDFVAESGKKVPYEFIDNRNANRAYVENFDLYGALLLKKFNSEQVF